MGYISVVPPYTLIVSADSHPVNPRSYECFGKLICFKPIRIIGDPHTYENNNAFAVLSGPVFYDIERFRYML